MGCTNNIVTDVVVLALKYGRKLDLVKSSIPNGNKQTNGN